MTASSQTGNAQEQVPERYWWAHGPDGWVIETHRGEPLAENVVAVGRAASLEDAEALVAELNRD